MMNIPTGLGECLGSDCFNRTSCAICDVCWAYRTFTHSDLGVLFHEAGRTLGQIVRQPHVRVAGPPGPRTPIRDALFDAQLLTAETVGDWASVIRGIRKLSPLPPLTLGRKDWIFDLGLETLQRLDSILEGSVDQVSYYNAVYRRWRHLDRLVRGSTVESEHVDGVCWTCSSATLVSREHRGYVVCLTCGSRCGNATWNSLRRTNAAQLTGHSTVRPERE